MISSISIKELNSKMTHIQKIVDELKKINSKLVNLSLGESNIEKIINELSKTTKMVNLVTKEQIDADITAREASEKMSLKIAEIKDKLRAMNFRIKYIQGTASENLSSYTGIAINASGKIRKLYELSKEINLLKIAYEDLINSENERSLALSKDNFSQIISKTLTNDLFVEKDEDEDIDSLYYSLEDLQKSVIRENAIADIIMIYLHNQANNIENDKIAKQKKTMGKDISQSIDNIVSDIAGFMEFQLEDIDSIDLDFKDSVKLSGISNNMFQLSYEITSTGQSIEGTANKILLAQNTQELIKLIDIISRKLSDVNSNIKKLFDIFISIGGKKDDPFFQDITKFFKDVENMFIGEKGISKRIEKALQAHNKTLLLSQQIENIVIEQQNESKIVLSDAALKQENATITVNSLVKKVVTISIILGVIGIVIGIVAGILGAKTIGSSISKITKVASSVSRGDLSQEIKVFGPSEIRSMGQCFIKMKTDLKNMIQRTITSAHVISNNSSELLNTADSLNKGLHEQTALIEQAATSMEEMNQTIADVSKNASNAAEESKTSSHNADRGRNSVERTVDEMLQIVGTFNNTSSIIEKLGISSKEIGNIVEVIKDIADQTNLLALNAAIEAARAGEQGRGFAVVADEVRKLAEQCTKASNQIASMIKGVQEDIDMSVSSMDSGKSMVEKGVKSANESLELLGEIVTDSNKSMEMMELIATATEEQAQTSNDIASNMDHIARIARTSNESADIINDASHEFTRLSNELTTLISWFKINSQTSKAVNDNPTKKDLLLPENKQVLV